MKKNTILMMIIISGVFAAPVSSVFAKNNLNKLNLSFIQTNDDEEPAPPTAFIQTNDDETDPIFMGIQTNDDEAPAIPPAPIQTNDDETDKPAGSPLTSFGSSLLSRILGSWDSLLRAIN